MPKRKRRRQKVMEPQIYVPSTSILPPKSRDIYDAMCDSYRTTSSDECSLLHPPSHWLNSIATFTKDNEDHATCEEIRMLTNHLNQLKSNLNPYCEIVSELKNQRHIHTTPQNEFRRASRDNAVNPYESLYFTFDGEDDNDCDSGTPLVSRSALKLCNIDALAGFVFAAKAKDISSKSGITKESSIFVDLCGAPGGFSQYLTYRGGYSRGYGMSLHGRSSTGDSMGVAWNVSAIEKEERKEFTVCTGKDGTGDIYNWENVLSLERTIQNDSESDSIPLAGALNSTKVAVVVADGGIDAQRNAPDQELIANKLVASQTAAALYLLDNGGIFVIKMFGFQSHMCRKLMAFVCREKLFKKVMVIKPVTSRPASAERYVFCKGFKRSTLGEDFDFLKLRDKWLENNTEDKADGTDRDTSDMSSNEDKRKCMNFLNLVDRDLLCLNIRACTNIIKYLRDEEEKMLRRKKGGRMWKDNFSLNIAHLKKEWKVGKRE